MIMFYDIFYIQSHSDHFQLTSFLFLLYLIGFYLYEEICCSAGQRNDIQLNLLFCCSEEWITHYFENYNKIIINKNKGLVNYYFIIPPFKLRFNQEQTKPEFLYFQSLFDILKSPLIVIITLITRWRTNLRIRKSTLRASTSKQDNRKMNTSPATKNSSTATVPKPKTTKKNNVSIPSSWSSWPSPSSQQKCSPNIWDSPHRPPANYDSPSFIFFLLNSQRLSIHHKIQDSKAISQGEVQVAYHFGLISALIFWNQLKVWCYNPQMIRGGVLSVLLIALLAASVFSAKTEKIEITKVSRTVTLSGAYAGQNIKISFVANDDSISHFTYLTPLDYDDKIAKIWFSKNEKDRSSLTYVRSLHAHEGQTYAKYVIALPHNYQVGDIGEIAAHIVYLYRYENLPSSIALKQDQKLLYEDVKYIVSPYHIVQHESVYKFAKIHEYDPDGVKKGSTEVEFNKNSLEPYTHVKHSVFGVNNNAQVQFTHVEKVIEVSHWGNIGITENYKIVNKGPSLKGQFSRVTFGSKGYDIGSAFHGIDFDLPYEIWGLYYLDEVGNISTSRAYRDHGSNVVRMSMMPRFALLGGWKSNWQIGYNLYTKGHLFHDGNTYALRNVKLEYALERILAEEFVVKVVLPEGAENVNLKIDGVIYDSSSLQVSRSQGYLDFNGRPTYTIPNYRGSIKDKQIEVYYTFPANHVYKKPIFLTVIVLAFLISAIFLKRFKLQAFEEKQE